MPRYVDYQGSEYATAVLNVRAPVGGARWALWSDDPGIASVPAELVIVAGEQYGSFSVAYEAVGTTQVHAQLVEVGGIAVVGAPIQDLDVQCLPGGDVSVYEVMVAVADAPVIEVEVEPPPAVGVEVEAPEVVAKAVAPDVRASAEVADVVVTVETCEPPP
jgi:hypothetical protein